MRIRLAAAVLFVATFARAQSIVTIAGGGPIGDGRPATEALLNEPQDTAIDAAGNLYISDTKNQRVRRVDVKTGIITTYAGGGTSGRGDGGPAVEAALLNPAGLAIDSEGNLYIGSAIAGKTGQADPIRRVSPDGIITTYNDATSVTGMAFDRDGNLHVPFRCTVRKIDRTGASTTVAGSGQCDFSGDGGPATAAGMSPGDVAFDRAGNLFIADTFNSRVRRVDATTGIITTVAGNGVVGGRFESGKPATETAIFQPASIAFDAEDNLFIGNIRVDARTGIATFAGRPDARAIGRGLSFDSDGNLIGVVQRTVGKLAAGSLITSTDSAITIAGGRFIGEDGPALGANLSLPYEVLALPNGDLLFSEQTGLIRKIESATGRVVRFAGSTAGGGISFEGLPALEATFPPTLGLTRDSSGNLYFSTTSGVILKIDAATSIVARVAGALPPPPTPAPSFGDGGPALQATFNGVLGVAVHPNGDLFLADLNNYRIRKIDVRTGIITTFAGSGPTFPEAGGFAGDGGPATSARLNFPSDVALDGAGNLYISDTLNGRIRKVDAVTGVISTIAGRGAPGPVEGPAEGPALQVDLGQVIGIHSDATGNLWFTLASGAVRRFDARSGLVSVVAGAGRATFTGDSGPARAAGLNETTGVDVDARGNVFIADRSNNRVRAVFACATVDASSLQIPENEATGISTAPTLSWSRVPGAFRYDVFLDTKIAPATLVASDLTVTSFTPSNLTAETRYFWRVVAKGDPFCVPFSTSGSLVRSFTTVQACDAPGPFDTIAPADAATNLAPSLSLSWQAATGAGTYDVFFGPVNPPPFLGSTTATSFAVSALAPGTTYYWLVVARASCDRGRTTSTAVRSFTITGQCPMPGLFVQITPAAGATGVGTSVILEWSPSANASTYDLFFGDRNNPLLFRFNLTSLTSSVGGLVPGRTYYWRVTARASCDPTRTVTTPVSSFTIRSECQAPQATTLRSTPAATVTVGQSYVLSWDEATDLAPDGFYVIERSPSESFATSLETQQTAATSASFVASQSGLYFHRVRAVNPCNGSQASANSATRTVTVASAAPNVIFTVQPRPVITTLGQNIEDLQSGFVIENIGTETTQVVIGRQEINSPPFFTVVDPAGGDAMNVTLEPRNPKVMEIRFSGPPNDQPAAFQGLILLSSPGRSLAVTPYAFINLSVGGGVAATPRFQIQSGETEYAFFPGFAGDDTNRPSISVEIHNPGTTPMELGAEIGPELWLVPESGWNATAIPPGASRTLRLFTQRSRAPHASALPRYTYLTVRTKSGQSARLLVQDNDLPPRSLGRAGLDPSSRSLIVPEVSSMAVAGASARFSVVRISNVGSDPLITELFFTPQGSDGFDAMRVQRATIAVPPNDVVTLTDPLVQLWNLPRPVKGQLEIRAAQEKIGQLAVNATVTQAATGGGAFTTTIPTVTRAEGARSGIPHAVAGLSSNDTHRAALVVAETSGADRVTVRVTLIDAEGTARGERVIDVSRFSMMEIDDVATSLAGGVILNGARLELSVTEGNGSALGLVKLLDRVNGGGATLVSRSAETATSANLRATEHRLQPVPSQTAPIRTFLLPAVLNGQSGGAQLQTTIGLYAPRETTTFNLTYREGDLARTATVMVQARRIVEYANALQQLFGLTSSEGSLLIETTGLADVYARLTSANTGMSRVTVSQTLPIISSDSEFVTTAGSQRSLYLDGLEQSIDPTRGTNWSLILNEITGKGATVIVRLYEAGNRSAPILQKEFSLAALQRLKLPSVFGSLDLDSINRRKDRTNMLVSVVYKSGAGAATAIAMATDNRTGDSKSYILGPPGATSPFSIQRATAIAPTAAERRRAVRH